MCQQNREKTTWRAMFVCAFVALITMLTTHVSYANPEAEVGGMRHIQRMADQLGLSDEQRQQFKQIHSDSRVQGKVIHQALRLNHQAMRKLDPGVKNYTKQVADLAGEEGALVTQAVEHHGQLRANVYAILTPKQREKAAALKMPFRKGGKYGKGKGDCGEGEHHHNR
ncbi:MAG: Spy/CpxP family protein refolding chaperone [Mariprofundus sp.]|nr:Spy/CpxP family protein refolding chaperone [Mariprofundus sp.]